MKSPGVIALIILMSFTYALGEPAQEISDATIELNSVISTAEFVYSGQVNIRPVPDILRNCLEIKTNYENHETTITFEYNKMCQFMGQINFELLNPTKASNLQGNLPRINVYLSTAVDMVIITDRRKLEKEIPVNYYATIRKYIDKAADMGLTAKYVELNNLKQEETAPDSTIFKSNSYYLINYEYLDDDVDVKTAVNDIAAILSPKLLYILGGYSIIPTFEITQGDVILRQKVKSDEPYLLNNEESRKVNVIQDELINDDGYIYSAADFKKLDVTGISTYATPIDLQNHIVKYDAIGSSFYAPRRHGQHNGVDFFAPIGVPVYAADAGVINDARFVKASCGNMIVIKTLPSSPMTWFKYCHLDRFAPGIKKGATVEKGQLIAYSGNTQSVLQGAHLHFEAFKGGFWASEEYNAIPIDPVTMYPNINFPRQGYKQVNQLAVNTQDVTKTVTARLYTNEKDDAPANTITVYLQHAITTRPSQSKITLILTGKSTQKSMQTNSNNLLRYFKSNAECTLKTNCYYVPKTCLNMDDNDCDAVSTISQYTSILLNLQGTPTSAFVQTKNGDFQFATATELFQTIKTPAIIIAEQGNTLNVLNENDQEIENTFTQHAIKTGSTIIGRSGPYVLSSLNKIPKKDYTAFELASQMKTTAINEQNTISALQWMAAKQIAIVGDPLAKINLS